MSGAGRMLFVVVRLLTVVYWLGIFTLTHLPPSELPKTNVSDKLAHFVTYAILALLLYLSLLPLKKTALWMSAVVLAATWVYGAMDELTQPLVGRTASLEDWFADAGGAACAVVVAAAVDRLTRLRRKAVTSP